jgi:hypothetical protein
MDVPKANVAVTGGVNHLDSNCAKKLFHISRG